MGVCEAKPYLTSHSSPGVCRIPCLLLRVELPFGKRCLNELIELSSAGKLDLSAPSTLDARGRD